MAIKDISADPKKPLTVAEFKKAFEHFWDVLSHDSLVQTELDIASAGLQDKCDDAIRATKFQVYKDLFWSRKRIERPEYDP